MQTIVELLDGILFPDEQTHNGENTESGRRDVKFQSECYDEVKQMNRNEASFNEVLANKRLLPFVGAIAAKGDSVTSA